MGILTNMDQIEILLSRMEDLAAKAEKLALPPRGLLHRRRRFTI